jgi:Sulfotransferase family
MRTYTINASAPELMAEARQRTAIDIIDTEIEEALTRLLPSLNSEAQLSESGAQAMHDRLQRVLCNRLRMLRDYRDHPEIDNEKIVRPLILCGGGRTGSTKLHKLLAASGDFKYMTFWQVHNPSLRSGNRFEDPAPRIREADEFIRWFDARAPQARQIHAYDTHDVEEETHIYEQGFLGFYIFAVAFVPSFMAWYAAQDFGKQLDYFIQVVKYLQWQFHADDPRPWLFKYPAYQSYEPELRQRFPDGVLVATHRDPVSTMTSSASLFSAFYRAYSEANHDAMIGMMMLEGQAGRHQLLLDARRNHPDLGVLDLSYTELTGDSDAMLKKIYAHAGMALDEQSLHAMHQWERDNAQHMHGAHRYTLEQFGLSREIALQKFAPYRERFGRWF